MNQSIQYELDAVMPTALDTGLFSSVCTFQVPAAGFGTTGFVSTSYVDVAGLVDLACTAPPSGSVSSAIQAKEQKGQAQTLATNASHVLLGGYYPAAETAWRQGGRMVIDGQIFPNNDILGVESSSQQRMTRAAVRVASV